jgi:hypothetical protein
VHDHCLHIDTWGKTAATSRSAWKKNARTHYRDMVKIFGDVMSMQAFTRMKRDVFGVDPAPVDVTPKRTAAEMKRYIAELEARLKSQANGSDPKVEVPIGGGAPATYHKEKAIRNRLKDLENWPSIEVGLAFGGQDVDRLLYADLCNCATALGVDVSDITSESWEG